MKTNKPEVITEESLAAYYIEKLGANERLSTFLGFFEMPKHPYVFLCVTAMGMAMIANATNFWIPSVVAVITMWNCLAVYRAKHEIADRCAVTEEIMVLEDAFDFPVTDEERDSSMETHVMEYCNMSILQKAYRHRSCLAFVLVLYITMYCVVKLI